MQDKTKPAHPSPYSSKVEAVNKHGKTASGRRDLLKYLEGARITQRQAIIAKCYDCMAFYADGRSDCKFSDCPLYPFMPYSTKPQTPTRKLSKAHKEKFMAGKNKLSKLVEPLSEGV